MDKIDYKSAYATVLIANGMLRQENNQLKEQKQELRIWLEEQYQEYKETSDERGIVLTSYVIDKLNELEGKNE